MVNHDRLSADYTTSPRQTWWVVLYGALGRQPVPEAFVRNHRRVWTALTQVSWPETGVIYQPDGTISYPAPADVGSSAVPDVSRRRMRWPTSSTPIAIPPRG